MKPFERVWAWVRKVPRGRVVTYGQLSILIGRRLSPVGVGWAMAAAPKKVPWQRVVNSKGTISTRGQQRALLEKEGVRFDREGRIALDEFQWHPRARVRKAR